MNDNIISYINNPKLWKKAVDEVNKIYKKHSAYRSLAYFKEYKKLGGTYNKTKLNNSLKNLRRWELEQWKNQKGKTGYQDKGDIYRPTKRINKNTPLTFGELNTEEIYDAMEQKKEEGRVKSFRPKPLFNLYKSPIKTKKYMVQATQGDDILFTVHFGGVKEDGTPYMDYIQYYQKEGKETANEKKRNYIKRHSINEDYNNYRSAGFWSRFVLWNKSSLKSSFLDAVKRTKKILNI